MPPSERRPALFLDRDGLLNELVFYPDSSEWESPRVPADLVLIPGVLEALQGFHLAGWPMVLISNQPSHAKGKASLGSLQAVHQKLASLLLEGGIHLEAVKYCFHHPQGSHPDYSGGCICRKPSPFMVQEAARACGFELELSWMIGDQDTDISCGQSAGCRTILIPCEASASKRGNIQPDFTCSSLGQARQIIGMNPALGRRL